MIFGKILQEMLKQNLTLQMMKQIDRYVKKKIKKVVRFMKDIIRILVGQRSKIYNYLNDNGEEHKKPKGT